MAETHVWIEQPKESADHLTLSATIEIPGGQRKELWYRVPVEDKALLTQGHDPFVLGTLFMAMRAANNLVIHGEVSPSLLRNLEEFQAAWVAWKPGYYSKIEIRADLEREQPLAGGPPLAISAFSGGVDGCFTVWRHRTGRCGRLRRNLEAGLLVHGLDIPLEQPEVFGRAAANARLMLDSLDVKLLQMATNFKKVAGHWEDVFAAGVASCLMLYQGRYSLGLVGSSEPYSSLVFPWGSNPVTDWLMSSEAFDILHDGAAYTRTEKVQEIVAWPEAIQYLRVCWAGDQLDKNCGRCEKCIRTLLNFRVVGHDKPVCLPYDLTNRQILEIRNLNIPQIVEFEQILSAASKASINHSWVSALASCVKQNRRALTDGEKLWFRAERWLETLWLRIRRRLGRMFHPAKPI